MNKLFVFSCLCLFASTVQAQQAQSTEKSPIYLNLNTASYHFSHKRQYNETNIGLGAEQHFENKWGWMAGIYKNSFYQNSLYAAAVVTPVSNMSGDWNNSFRIFAGMANGYESVNKKYGVLPIAGIILSSEYQSVGLNIVVTPTVTKLKAVGFAAVQIKYKLD